MTSQLGASQTNKPTNPAMRDVFLSYAHVDNVAISPYAGDSTLSGWMDVFKYILKDRVSGQAGIREDDDLDWFIDNQSIRAGQDIPEEVQSALNKARAFVVLASRASTNPKSYCRAEWQIIANRIRNETDLSVFGVLIDPDGEDEFRSVFPGKKAIRFYEKDKDERPRRLGNTSVNDAFIESISNLAEDIGQTLTKNRPEANTMPLVDPSKVVFVAWTSPDLEFQRRELIGKIEKNGWNVISRENFPPPDKNECEKRLQEHMSSAVVSIHLIGPYQWELESLQLEEAARQQKRTLVYATHTVAASIAGSERAKSLESHRLMVRHPTQMFQELQNHLRSLQAKAIADELMRQTIPDGIRRLLASVCISSSEQAHRIARVSKPLKDKSIDPIVRQVGEFEFDLEYLSECAAHQNGHAAISGTLDEKRLRSILEDCQERYLEAIKTNGRFPPQAVIYTSKSRKKKIESRFPGHWISHLLIDDDEGLKAFASKVSEFPPAHPSPKT